MSNAKEAAERYRRHNAITGPDYRESPYYCVDKGLDYDLMRSDECAMRDAYLAKHPADDDEPITVEWLSSDYTKRSDWEWSLGNAPADDDDELATFRAMRRVRRDSHVFVLEVTQHHVWDKPKFNHGIGVLVTTRRQLRTLLAAFGVGGGK